MKRIVISAVAALCVAGGFAALAAAPASADSVRITADGGAATDNRDM
ncbi:hypothetical protein HII36_47745 [Nonomuraea sp. NN258]|nr:hypothetical protein [Nonomuraea antri]NRQ39471.1 hypothetical protein [Nonomuraea antri]